jgi:hypothetical protein
MWSIRPAFALCREISDTIVVITVGSFLQEFKNNNEQIQKTVNSGILNGFFIAIFLLINFKIRHFRFNYSADPIQICNLICVKSF